MGMLGDFWNFITGRPRQEGLPAEAAEELSQFLDRRKAGRLALYEAALESGTSLVANALSRCEFRTFVRGVETKGAEYYLWNYQPNRSMNSSEFFHRVVWNLVRRNECLVVEAADGGLWPAGSFARECGVYRDDVFRDVSIPLADGQDFRIRHEFRMGDVLYYRMNNRNLQALLSGMMEEYQGLFESAAQKFYKAGGEKGVLKIGARAVSGNYGSNADGTPRTFQDVYREMTGRHFAEYFKSANAVMPLFDGFDYETRGTESRKSTSDMKDVLDMADEIYARVGNALQIPPAVLKGDVADVAELTRNMLTFAVDPLAKMIERENNRKRNGRRVLKGTYQMADTSCVMHADALGSAQGLFNLVGSGYSVNEARRKAGDAPIPEAWADRHMVSLNFAGAEDGGGTGGREGAEDGRTGQDA